MTSIPVPEMVALSHGPARRDAEVQHINLSLHLLTWRNEFSEHLWTITVAASQAI